jgi:chemotaxis protein CheD
MKITEAELPTIYLRSGEIYFTDRPSVVITVLGSCVSVILFHRQLGLSSICHGSLPRCVNKRAWCGVCHESAKFVECSLRTMVDRFKQSGVELRELETRIYGGACMFSTRPLAEGAISVGKQNITTAQKLIDREGLKVVSSDIGGVQGRKIVFNTATGEVMLKRLLPQTMLANRGAGA